MTDPVELRLRQLAALLNSSDPLLQRLVGLAADGLGVQFSLVLELAGKTVQGTPVAERAFAEMLDEDVQNYFEVARAIFASRGETSEGFERILENLAEEPFFIRAVEERQEMRDRFFEAMSEQNLYDAKLPELPDDLVDDAIQIGPARNTVTLENASIRHAGGDWAEVGHVRVLLSQVQAWWTVRLGAPEEALPYLT